MISRESLELFVNQYKSLSTGHGSGIGNVGTLGIVVNTDDPLQQGRLQVFCPSLSDNPKKILHLPWCVYLSPFGGSISHKEYARGVGEEGVATGSEGAIHYGFWAIPEAGAHVLVGCVDGDSRRRIWMGCVPEHQETHTILGGRYDWSGPNGTPDGPFTSKRKPIQPLYDNMTAAFGDRKSKEWKTRGADYQATAILSSEGQAPNDKKGTDYLDEDYDDIASHEEDEWVKERLGAHGYDWSGFKDVGAMKASRVFGFGSPGMHFMSMDDRPWNSRMKFQTATGHVILLDDTNERIYIKTNKGNNWVEMDSNGNIDIYSSKRISISSDNDINLTSKGSLRMYAGESIHMYAGHNLSSEDNAAGVLLEEPAIKGEIRIQAESDHHIIAKNIRQKSHENTYHETGINKYDNVGESAFMTVEKDHNLNTNSGDILSASGRHVSTTAKVDMKHFAEGKGSFAAVNDTEVHSFDGKLSASSKGPTIIKSATDNVDIQASSHSGAGSVTVKTPNSQQVIGTDGIKSATTGTIVHTSAGDQSLVSDPALTQLGLSGMMNGELMAGSGTANIIKIATSNISMNAALGDIIQKTAMTGHSYDVLTNKVDELTTALDQTIYQTSQISTAVGTAISALSGNFSIPFSFNIGCLTQSLFGALPSGLTSVYATFSALQSALAALGHVVNSMEEALALIEGNVSLLSALGLPNISFGLNFTSSACVPLMQKFTGSISVPSALSLTPIPLRSLIHKIYENGATWGPLPTKPALPAPTPCPLTPVPANEV